jgi:LCP family protein required for cell wall assembly
MQNKRPRPQAIDNFIPSGRPMGGSPNRRPPRFPDVGMTMSPYRNAGFSASGGTSVFAPPARRAKKRRFQWRWTKKRVIFVILLPFILIALWLGVKFGFNAARIFNGNLFSIFSTTRLRGEENGRVNILLAGNSADDPGHNGGNLTDSIMILSLDTRNNRAFMLSIPRDLYVTIPGNGHSKINEAYVDGKTEHFNEPGYPKGGMGLLEKTINDTIGVRTQYYALINYAALRDAVNAVGGVDFTVKSTDPRGLYDGNIDWVTHGPLVRLSNGTHHLNGEQALDLSRARGDPPAPSYGFANSDFTRAQNQRQLLISLKKKVLSAGTLANPIKVSSLFDSLGRNVTTDMELSEARRFIDLIKQDNDSQIKSYGLNDINGKNYLMSYRTLGGESALVPAAGLDDFSQIQQVLHKLMSTNKVSLESANVVVLNGTDVYGLAGKNETMLQNRNISVTAVADAQAPATKTFIINVAGKSKPATLRELKNLYGTKVTKTNPYQGKYQHADFIVVLGNDRVASLD